MTESPGRRNIHGKRNSSLVVNEFIIKLRLLAGEGEHSLQDHSHRLLIINFPDDCDLPKLIFGRGDKTGHISGSHRIGSYTGVYVRTLQYRLWSRHHAIQHHHLYRRCLVDRWTADWGGISLSRPADREV